MTSEHRPWFEKWLLTVADWLGLSRLVAPFTDRVADQNRAKALFRPTASGPPHDASVPSLLHPERSPVPFKYRDEDLNKLERWCYDDAGHWARWKLVTGESGRGKTRLLMELITTLQADAGRPWHAGFLDMAKLRTNLGDLECFQRLPGDLLFVIDYAERFEPEVRAILKASLKLADERTPRRVRVVLISRRHSELWQKIGERDSGEDISDAMGSGRFSVFEPQPLGRDLAARNHIFDDAYAAFETHFKEPRPLGQRPDLNRPGFNEIVLIHLAALSLYRREMQADKMSEDDLLDYVLDRERRRWNETVENKLPRANLEEAPIEQAAAILTFVSLGAGIESRERTVALLGNCPLLKGVDAPTLSTLADIFRNLYPSAGWVNGLTPDLIGTHLLNVTDDKSMGTFMRGLTETEATNGLTKLNWVAQRWPDSGRRKLEAAIDANPKRVFPLAVRVALESGDPIGQIAATWLEAHPNYALAEDLEPAIPFPTTALREMAEAVQGILYAATANTNEEATLGEHARHAHNRAVRLSDLGRREEALAAVEEALKIYRRLAEERPDAFLPVLAASLNNLGVFLSELDRREAALAAVEESLEIRRKLAEERPDAFLHDLAGSLNNLGGRLSELGRREAALAAAEEALQIYRRLAEERPDASLPDLAASLNNLGVLLSELGRREAALAAAEEAVEIRRRLAEERPDAFLPDLATSLNNLSSSLSDLGRREEALAAVEEALEIYRRLAEERPDAFLPDLARSFGTLGRIRVGLADNTEARSAFAEGIRSLARLFEREPKAYSSLMAGLLGDYVQSYEQSGEAPDEALIGPIAKKLNALSGGDPEETDQPA